MNKISIGTSKKARIFRLTATVIALTVLLAASAMFLFGCRGREQAGNRDGIVVSPSYTLYLGEHIDNESQITAPLGTPVERQESQSCIAVGTDVSLTYDGFSITLYPDEEGGHYVGSIKISSSSYSTVSGARPGLGLQSVDDKLYSLSSGASKTYIYTMNGTDNYLMASVDASDNISMIILVSGLVSE